MNEPLVSILIPTYNSAVFLKELCDSIQSQTYKNFEVLIGDDGSSDDSLEILKPFRTDKRFLISNWTKNRGVTSATNILFGMFRGEYWSHPGADDLLHPDFIEQRVALMEANPQAAMIHGQPDYINELGTPIKGYPEIEFPPEMSGERALRALIQHNFINVPSVMVRSSVTKRILPFFSGDWTGTQDWLLWILHFATGFDLLWDTRRLHKYRIHSQSLSRISVQNSSRHAESRLIPLHALSMASQFSNISQKLWMEWRRDLYAMWLRRAFSLKRHNALKNQWLQLGAYAFYGRACPRKSLYVELVHHARAILMTSHREKLALAKQSFRVSGLAQIDDPIFR